MRKKILLIVLSIIILSIMVFLGNKYLTTSSDNTTSQPEIILEEKNIELKGFTDPRKFIYETDKAVIKLSYDSEKRIFLNKLKFDEDNLKKSEKYLAKDSHPNISENKIRFESRVNKGKEFMNWLEEQKDKEEINITSKASEGFLKQISYINVYLQGSIRLGEVEIYDKERHQNLKSVKFKDIKLDDYNGIYRFYLPNNKIFLETTHGFGWR